jgi:hypothetical protein
MKNDDTINMLVNPSYAINIAPAHCKKREEHMVTEEEWVQANVNLVKEIGADEVFRRQLKALKEDHTPIGYLDDEIKSN